MLDVRGAAGLGDDGGGLVMVFLELDVVGVVGVRFIVGFGEVVGEGGIAGGAEEEDIGAVFVLDTEDSPEAAAADFGEGDHEA